MSKAHLPPVPPAERPKQGGGNQRAEEADRKNPAAARDVNVEQVGQTANTEQNTRNQGFQQDR